MQCLARPGTCMTACKHPLGAGLQRVACAAGGRQSSPCSARSPCWRRCGHVHARCWARHARAHSLPGVQLEDGGVHLVARCTRGGRQGPRAVHGGRGHTTNEHETPDTHMFTYDALCATRSEPCNPSHLAWAVLAGWMLDAGCGRMHAAAGPHGWCMHAGAGRKRAARTCLCPSPCQAPAPAGYVPDRA